MLDCDICCLCVAMLVDYITSFYDTYGLGLTVTVVLKINRIIRLIGKVA